MSPQRPEVGFFDQMALFFSIYALFAYVVGGLLAFLIGEGAVFLVATLAIAGGWVLLFYGERLPAVLFPSMRRYGDAVHTDALVVAHAWNWLLIYMWCAFAISVFADEAVKRSAGPMFCLAYATAALPVSLLTLLRSDDGLRNPFFCKRSAVVLGQLAHVFSITAFFFGPVSGLWTKTVFLCAGFVYLFVAIARVRYGPITDDGRR
jgi:hypothetical protein